jgi:hypothetical protein
VICSGLPGSGAILFYVLPHLYCDGEHLRYLPLSDRKHRLKGIIPHLRQRLLYCDHIDGIGESLFRLACERDLEGIVAKRRFDPYLLDGSASWFKIKNPSYSQWAGREELFEHEPSTDPDMTGWNVCASACDVLVQRYGTL